MNLVVDIGNSRFKWSVVTEGPWQEGQAESLQENMADLLDRIWGNLLPPQAVVIANVSGIEIENKVKQWLLANWNLIPSMFRSSAQFETIVNTYTNPEQLGCDRWAAIIGARSLNQGNLCVIDCGTAVTIDVLKANDEYVGGAILPGIHLSRKSLLAGTSDILEVDFEFSGHLGRNTGQAVAAGTLYSIVGGIERILAELNSVLGETRVFLTGGDAPNLIPLFNFEMDYQPDLVLIGLAQCLR